jgi:hypothetical protein
MVDSENRLEGNTRIRAARLEVRDARPAVGALDVILLALPVDKAGLETLALFEDRFLLADDPLAERIRVTTNDVNARKLILLDELTPHNPMGLGCGGCSTLTICPSA